MIFSSEDPHAHPTDRDLTATVMLAVIRECKAEGEYTL